MTAYVTLRRENTMKNIRNNFKDMGEKFKGVSINLYFLSRIKKTITKENRTEVI